MIPTRKWTDDCVDISKNPEGLKAYTKCLKQMVTEIDELDFLSVADIFKEYNVCFFEGKPNSVGLEFPKKEETDGKEKESSGDQGFGEVKGNPEGDGHTKLSGDGFPSKEPTGDSDFHTDTKA